MKIIVIILMMFFCISCNNQIAGTLGGGYIYEFDCSESELNKCLEMFKKANLNLSIPEKWKEYDDWDKRGYHFLNGKIYYLKGNAEEKEEMYYVSVLKFNDMKTKVAQVSIRAVFRKTRKYGKWFLLEDLKESDKEIVEKRFQESILNKIKDNDCSCRGYKVITN